MGEYANVEATAPRRSGPDLTAVDARSQPASRRIGAMPAAAHAAAAGALAPMTPPQQPQPAMPMASALPPDFAIPPMGGAFRARCRSCPDAHAGHPRPQPQGMLDEAAAPADAYDLSNRELTQARRKRRGTDDGERAYLRSGTRRD